MFVTAQDAQRRLSSTLNIVSAEDRPHVVHIDKKHAGRPNIQSDFQREMLGTIKRVSGQSCEEVAKAFDTSKQQVSNCARGMVDKRVDEDLRQRIDENTGYVREAAIGKLMETLGLLDNDKLKKENARGLASVARDLASVSERMSPRSGDNVNNGVQFIVHVPHQKKEDSYETIELA